MSYGIYKITGKNTKGNDIKLIFTETNEFKALPFVGLGGHKIKTYKRESTAINKAKCFGGVVFQIIDGYMNI